MKSVKEKKSGGCRQMRRILFVVCLVATGTGVQASGSDTLRTAVFQFSLCPRVGTNGSMERMYANHFSINLTVGLSGGERGVAVAGFSNVVRCEAVGVQVAGVSNHMGTDACGLVVGGLVNTVRGVSKGVMVAGAANHADEVRGVQLAGLYNVAGRVRGLQVGLVNVARSSDWTLGLVNVVHDGEMSLGLQYASTGSALLAFRSGGRHLYGLLGAGYNHSLDATEAIFGVGVRVWATSWLNVRNELTASSLYGRSDDSMLRAGYVLMPVFRLGRHVNITLGCGFDYLTSFTTGSIQPSLSWKFWQGTSTDRAGQLAFNLQAGLEWVF